MMKVFLATVLLTVVFTAADGSQVHRNEPGGGPQIAPHGGEEGVSEGGLNLQINEKHLLDDMESVLGRSKWCRSRDGKCRIPKFPCPDSYHESPQGKPYCIGKHRRCCYPEFSTTNPNSTFVSSTHPTTKLVSSTESSTAMSLAGYSLTAYACEGSSLAIECGVGLEINVTYANYGRTSNGICNDRGIAWQLNCYGDDTYAKVKNRCSGQSSCNVDASNAIFGDPCGGVPKYLEVNYVCEPVDACPSPWFLVGTQCFLGVKTEGGGWVDWVTARSKCGELTEGGDLAQPNDLKDLADALLAHGHSPGWELWIGGSDRETVDDYRWINGSSMTTGWYPGQPNNGGTSCVQMNPSKGANSMTDLPCDNPRYMVCQRP